VANFPLTRRSSQQAHYLLAKGEIKLALCHYAEAATFLDQARNIFRQLGIRSTEASALVALGRAYTRRRQFTMAADCHSAALTLCRGTSKADV
jgi:tetratricopeptide (TPR) repeat protein